MGCPSLQSKKQPEEQTNRQIIESVSLDNPEGRVEEICQKESRNRQLKRL